MTAQRDDFWEFCRQVEQEVDKWPDWKKAAARFQLGESMDTPLSAALAEIERLRGRLCDATRLIEEGIDIALRNTKEIERLREALGRIAKPTYGTELTDTDEDRAKHYWTLLQVMQHIARKALDAAKETTDG